MHGLGMPELILILIIALVIFGPSKLPEMGASVGKAIREFRNATKEADPEPERKTVTAEYQELPKQLTATPAVSNPEKPPVETKVEIKQ